jgi:uncharacterized Fe-S center protein
MAFSQQNKGGNKMGKYIRSFFLAVTMLFVMVSCGYAGESSKVFMTRDISGAGIMAIYNALAREASGNVAVKISTGEPGGTNFLSPALIKDLVQAVHGTIVESNTAYGGRRASTAMHKQVAEDHGFTAIADVDILDEDGSVSLPVEGGLHLTENLVGSHFENYDFFIILSHFKGHAMGGFGGAIKNTSIGIASSSGKSLIHTAGASTTNPWGGAQDPFLESMAEAAKSVSDRLGAGSNILYINVMNKLSVDCDCNSRPAAPDMHDIGILGSLDPVALDKACVDLVYAASDGQSLRMRMESRNGAHTLEHAERIGLGSQVYELSHVDQNSPEPEQPGEDIPNIPPPDEEQPDSGESQTSAGGGCNSNIDVGILALSAAVVLRISRHNR